MTLNTPGFRDIAQTGVIYVTTRANEHGYEQNHAEWANLGQGSPEAGDIEGAPARLDNC